jgi:MGT family glycosyltransferase
LQVLQQQAWKAAIERIWLRDGLPALNDARGEMGLDLLRTPFEQYDRVQRLLVLGHEAFDFPSRRPPLNMRYVGTPIDDAGVSQDAWKSPWPEEDSHPLILVSLSTLSQGQAPVMHRILDALAGLSVRAVVTLGPSLRKEDFRAPDNAVLEQFVPHSAVLPHMTAMVTQCGLGSFTKALLHGIPLVCLPLVGDQPDNAARIAFHGAGIVLGSNASAEQIRTALTRVLSEATFRQSAQRLAVLMQRERPEDRAAIELESLVEPARS